MDEPRWFVVHTHPRLERVVIRDLADKGFTAFLPIMRELRPAKPRRLLSRKQRLIGGRVACFVPVFPGYCFVQLDIASDEWFAICYIEGVKRLLRSGFGRPLPVPVGFVEMLQAETGVREREPEARSLTGASVVISDGPFATFDAIVTWHERDRIRALVTIMGRSTEVEMGVSQVSIP